ncbi:Asp23/Gls24 family envelope stress response protein [Paenarthrobacter sp. Z7-10]|uniref:Asp23/Gls24 family envelope stress response protein n=1 Tax=Paenarthrobacter sp. Z7-10 TaxID=2787635 RepID=UPI0022A91925|nr:Asp23/Gls24 family envelope stress response protein [Paenarthrobacter sp. Z7-10]MCZ2401639.1 Asp23/Gls24 family envelope stress response protein [Paenarthrobacter sp. Z7-10]
MTPDALDPGCGRTLEELSDYLSAGSSPDSLHMDNCPQCQAALAALRRLHTLTGQLLESDLHQAGSTDEPWFRSIMDNLRLETKAGRSIALAGAHPDDDLSETEGAVVALIRTIGDTVHGATIGKCRFNGNLETPGAPIGIEVNVTALWGERLPDLANTLRQTLAQALARHTELNVDDIDIAITDLGVVSPGSKGNGTAP